jgi:hypothetical protein
MVLAKRFVPGSPFNFGKVGIPLQFSFDQGEIKPGGLGQ